MPNDRNAFLAGLFMLGSAALAIFIVIAVKGASGLTEQRVDRQVTFALNDDIGGLRVGDDVRVGGAKVGSVSDIKITQDDKDAHIVVTFAMPARFSVAKNAQLAVGGTVTGTSWLNFSSLGTGEALGKNDTIAGKPSALGSLLATLGDVTPDVKAVVSDVRGAMADVKKTSVPKANAVLDKAYSAMDNISSLFGDTKPDFRKTMDNIAHVTGDFRERVPTLLKNADDLFAQLKVTLDSVNASLTDVRKIAADLRDVASEARSIVVGKRSQIDGMITSLKATADNLKNASAEIRRSPWRLLYTPKSGEVANLNLFDSARQFADGAEGLNSAAEALRDALRDNKADPARIQKLMDELDASFQRFNEVEAGLWDRVKK